MIDFLFSKVLTCVYDLRKELQWYYQIQMWNLFIEIEIVKALKRIWNHE